MKQILTIVLISITGFIAFAQTTAPKYSNEFLQIGVGARGLSLGKTQTASAYGANAAYWNPALLLKDSSRYNSSLMHAEYFAGIAKYNYGGFSVQIDSISRLAVSIIRFSIDDIPDTRFLFDANGALNYDNIRFFTASDNAFLFSYARKIKVKDRNFAVGGNAKIIYRKVGDFANSWGFGLDASAHYESKKWQFGAILRDATSTFNAWSINQSLLKDVFVKTGNIIPSNSLEITTPSLGIGVQKIIIQDSIWSLAGMTDFIFTFDGKRNTLIRSNFASISPRLGFEFEYKNTAYLRLGASQFQQLIKLTSGESYWSFEPSAGIGLRYKNINLDYALTNIGSLSGGLFSNIFSLNVAIY